MIESRERASTGAGARMRCLWIGRYIPYPINEGAKLYSAKLSESLAQSGAFVRVLGFGSTEATPTDRAAMEWIAVPGERRSAAAGIFSPLPLVAAVDAVPAYAALLEAQLREPWDVIVLDSYGSGWAMKRCDAYRVAHPDLQTILVHVSHNHEENVWRSMAQQASGAFPRRFALWQNYCKVRALEHRLMRSADLVTTITDEDACSLQAQRDGRQILTLTPGYEGTVAAERIIDSRTPRRAVIVGSFQWVVKRENLTRFIECADPLFARHGIELVVVGDVPGDLKSSLLTRCRATRFAGFVSDLAPLLSQARIAIVPELIGGGFKLKFLDYFFGRVPVACVSAAAVGLPPKLREQLLTSTDFPGLTRTIVEHIEQLDTLNGMQDAAFLHARTLFRWEDRGLQLSQRIAQLQRERAAARESTRYRAQAVADRIRS